MNYDECECTCRRCCCFDDDYAIESIDSVKARLHEHPIGAGKSGLVIDMIDNADLEIVKLVLHPNPEDLMGLPERKFYPPEWMQ